ncbi:MAG: DUF1552 domain-containing protein [Planctomycetota bacterium]
MSSISKADETTFRIAKRLDRRTVLRGSGIAMALPMLSAMEGLSVSAASTRDDKSPKRSVMLTMGLGLHAENLNPQTAGKNFESTMYLESFERVRDSMTVISGSSHPGVGGGHRAEASILTATPVGSAGRATNTISLDQFMAKRLGSTTRFPSVVLSTSGSTSPCYTESGSMISPMNNPRELFEALFVTPSAKQRQRQAAQVKHGRSIMDLVAEDARSLSQTLGRGDRHRLGEYFQSVRQLEQRLVEAEKWAKLPKPKISERDAGIGKNPNDHVSRFETMLGLIKLAIQTDSTRVACLHIPGSGGVIPLDGVDTAYHSLSHHGQDEDKLRQLAVVETAFTKRLADFLIDLRGISEGDSHLLDQTQVLLTSNLGNASNHSNKNMPVIFAGGGLKHGGHLAFDQKNNYPLSNLFVTMLQNMNMGVDRFSTGSTTLDGIGLG